MHQFFKRCDLPLPATCGSGSGSSFHDPRCLSRRGVVVRTIITMYSASNNINNYSIESKLQDVAATLRRERDQAHRSKGLAEERLRLVRSQVR